MLRNGERNGDIPYGDAPGMQADDTGLIHEQLVSAATPFLYLLSSVLIAAGGYLLYLLFQG